MLHFTMNMPFILMAFYGSVMILIILLLRALLKRRLPKFVFPILWCVVLIRLLVPFSLSSPLSIKATSWFNIPNSFTEAFFEHFSVNTYTVEAQSADLLQSEQDSSYALSEYIYSGSATADTDSATAQNDAVSQVAETSEGVYSGTGSNGSWRFPRAIPLIHIYLPGLFITIAVLLIQKYRCHMRLKNSLLIEHNETINAILREMDMGHILVFTNDEIASPLVCGLLTPRIYLPTRMDFKNTELLRHILSHETMHIRRKDNVIKAVMLAAICINWFNPLVWLMSKCLSSDLEAACDEAVIRKYGDDEQRKSYAFSLLEMAITGNRTTLLYSAFSKTEVEKRIQNVISYKKAPVLLICATVIFMLCSSAVFATCPTAPFSSYLTSYCASSAARWGVKVELARDISLGTNPQKRAEDIVLDILSADTSNDPAIIEEQIKTALSDEFHVEKGVFLIYRSLCISDKEKYDEYARYELIKDDVTGFFTYKGEPVRTFVDETGGHYQSRWEGTVDITVIRDRQGYITNILAQHEGDNDFDRRTRSIDADRLSYGSALNEITFWEH